MKEFTVNESDLLWTAESDRASYVIYITDPRFPGDKPFERIIYQLENFEGVRLPHNVINTVRKLFDTAADKNESFIDNMAKATATGLSKVTSELRASLERGDATEAASALKKEWEKTPGTAAVVEAVRQLLTEPVHTEQLRSSLRAVAQNLGQDLADEASIAVLTELINTASGELDELIALYFLRAAIHTQTGNSQEAENDALFGLSASSQGSHNY